MGGGWLLKNSIPFVALMVSVCCLLVIMSSVLKLPEVSPRNKVIGSDNESSNVAAVDEAIGGVFGEMMIEMLPQDLPFTLFVPSKKAVERDLRLRANDSFVAEKSGDAYTILSRVLGFSAVPRALSSTTMSSEKPVSYDSLSGFALHVSKDIDGVLIVNRIRSEEVDIRRREILVHVIDGVIMDAEFEQSGQPDDDGEESN